MCIDPRPPAGEGRDLRKGAAQLRRRLAESLRALRDVVAKPPLRRAEIAFALSCTAEWAFTIGLGVVAYRDGGPGAVGLVAVLRMVPSALALPFLSAVADRMRRERVVAVVSAVRAVAIGAIAAILETAGPGAAVYALAVIATIVTTVFRPALSALLPQLCTTTRELTSANVVRGIVDASGALVGPAVAGVLLTVSGPTSVFAGTAAVSLAAAIVLLGVRPEAQRRVTSMPRIAVVRDTFDGLHAVAANRDLTLVFGLGFAQTVVRGALNVFTVVVAFRLLGTDDAGVAELSFAVGAGGVVGSFGTSLLVGSRRLGGWLVVALVLWGAPFAVIGVATSEAVALAMLAVVGLGNAIIDVPLFTLPVRLADDALLARVFGVLESLVALGVGLGSILTPVLISSIGLRGALIAVGAVLPLLAALCRRRLRALDGRISVRDDEITVLRNAPMLGQLPVASIEHLASRLRRRRFPAGATIFEQGDPGRSFYLVVDGEADIIGDGTVVREVGRGESFGEIALLRDVPRTATVRARTDVDVYEVDGEAFVDALGGSGASYDAASAVVARNLANFTPARN